MIKFNECEVMNSKVQRAQGQAGFTLLESLVALLVLSVGLLGLAGLQAQGLQYNHDAYVRSQATMLAYDMVERMRLNAGAAADYVGAAPTAACGAGASLAEDDRACWHTAVGQTLPGGTAAITPVASSSPPAFTVTINWVDRKSGNTKTQSWQVVVTS